MNIETRTLVRAALDASDYTRGAQQVERANEGMARSGESAARGTDRVGVSMANSSSAIERLQRSLDQTYRAQQQFERAQVTINAAMERGAISAARAAELTALAQQRYLGVTPALNSVAAANDNAGRASGRFGQAMGQAGFQIQDFATQVSMGQNALTAFGVQFAQFAGIFGTAGAIAGAVVTVGVLALRLLGMGDAAEQAKRAQETLARATEATNRVMETQSEAAARQEREQRNAAVQALAAARATIAQAQAVRALRMAELEVTEEQVRAAREVGGPDTVLSGPAQRRMNELARLRGEVAQAAQEFQRLDEQIRTVLTAPSGAQRDRERQEAERREQEQQRQAERHLRDDARLREQQQREEDRARQQAEREEQRAREQQAREERRAQEERAREHQRATDEIVRYGAEAFADMFEANGRGWRGMLDSFYSTFVRLMARIAAEAIIRPIVSPIVQGIMGGVTGGASGGGLLGGAMQLLGLSNLSGGISEALGLGGLGASITGFLGAPLFGSAALSSATSSALGAMGGAFGPATAAQLGLGGLTVGTALGAAGLGFGAGNILNSLVGGKAEGGMLGSGAGAIAGTLIGAAFGMPFLGALLGGAGGGLLGGLFGPAPSNKEGNATLDFGSGRLTIGGQEGDKFSQENRDAATALAQQIGGTAAQIAAALGADLAAQNITVGVGNRDGIFARINGETMFSGARDEASVTALSDAVLLRLVEGLSGGQADLFRRLLADSGQEVTGQAAAELAGLMQIVKELTDPADELERALKAVNDRFDPLIETARKMQYGEEELAAAREKALQAARDAVRAPIIAAGGEINAFLDRLSVSSESGRSPAERLANARAAFDRSLAGAQSDDLVALRRVTADAEALLSASRDFYAGSQGFSAMRRFVEESLSGLEASQLARAQMQETTFDVDSMDALNALTASNQELQDRFDRLIDLTEEMVRLNERLYYSTPPTPVGVRS